MISPNRYCLIGFVSCDTWNILPYSSSGFQDSEKEETLKGMLSWCGHSDISKGTGYTFNSQETRQEASLHKIASFICMSFKPLWTDVLGETATLLSLCYFCEMQYASPGHLNNWAASPHCLPQQALGQDLSFQFPLCDCIIWDAMRVETQEAAWAEQSTCSQAPVVPQQFHSEPGLSFHTLPPSAACFIISQLWEGSALLPGEEK